MQHHEESLVASAKENQETFVLCHYVRISEVPLVLSNCALWAKHPGTVLFVLWPPRILILPELSPLTSAVLVASLTAEKSVDVCIRLKSAVGTSELKHLSHRWYLALANWYRGLGEPLLYHTIPYTDWYLNWLQGPTSAFDRPELFALHVESEHWGSCVAGLVCLRLCSSRTVFLWEHKPKAGGNDN